MCRATGAPTYVVHLSSARALAACAAARAEGLPIYVETRPLYLYLTSERYHDDDGRAVRGAAAAARARGSGGAVARAADGSIDTVASDHAPWTRELKLDPKLDITRGRPGVAELDTMLPLLYTEGVTTGRLSLERFVALTATNAAKLFGIYPRKGTIAVGSDADLAIWETRERRIVRDADMFSRAAPQRVRRARAARLAAHHHPPRPGRVRRRRDPGPPGSGEPIRRGPHSRA